MRVLLALARESLAAVVGFVAPLLPWIVTACAGAMIWNFAPLIGPAAQMERQRAETTVWRDEAGRLDRAARGWRASFDGAETLRKQESEKARRAAASDAAQCIARVAEARQSARIIERIVTKEPTYDENRCPVRSLVDPRELQRALQPSG